MLLKKAIIVERSVEGVESVFKHTAASGDQRRKGTSPVIQAVGIRKAE